MATEQMSTDDATRRDGSPLTEGLGHRLRSAGVWVRHDTYAAPEPQGYVRDSAPFEAADLLELQAREIAALRADVAAERERLLPDVQVLEAAVKVLGDALNDLLAACHGLDGNLKAPKKKEIMRARSMLPARYSYALSKRPNVRGNADPTAPRSPE